MIKLSRFSQKGFTLVEVMVSLSIMAIALTIIIQSAVLGTRLTDTMKETTIAVFLAEGKMAEAEMADDAAGAGGKSGNFDGDFKRFSWSRTEENVSPMDGLEMRKITLRVFHGGDREENVMELVTYLKGDRI